MNYNECILNERVLNIKIHYGISMNERQQQKQQTRERILATAIAYVSEKGFLGFDTAGIARIAGVSHGSIFSHFPRRDDLLVAVIQTICEKMLQAMDHKARVGRGARPVLLAQLRIVAGHEALFCHLVAQARYLPAEAQHWWTVLAATATHHLLEALPPGQRHRSAGTLWWALLEHYCLHAEQYSPGTSVLKSKGREILQQWTAAYGNLKGE